MYRTNRITSKEVARNYYYGIHKDRYYNALSMAKSIETVRSMQEKDTAAFCMMSRCSARTTTFEYFNKDSRRAQIV